MSNEWVGSFAGVMGIEPGNDNNLRRGRGSLELCMLLCFKGM